MVRFHFVKGVLIPQFFVAAFGRILYVSTRLYPNSIGIIYYNTYNLLFMLYVISKSSDVRKRTAPVQCGHSHIRFAIRGIVQYNAKTPQDGDDDDSDRHHTESTHAYILAIKTGTIPQSISQPISLSFLN